MYERGKTAAGAQVFLSAVRWRAFCEDKPDPKGRRCQATLKNFRRMAIGRGYGQVDGITWEEADNLAALAAKDGTRQGCRTAAIFSVMSDALLRVSEVVSIDLEHVDFANHTLYIPRSKTDQTGKGAVLTLGPPTLDYIRRWTVRGKITEGILFRHIQSDFLFRKPKRLKHESIRIEIKKRTKQAGMKGRYSGHSFRVGSAESLVIRGASIVQMQRDGRWSSPEMPAYYTRNLQAAQSAVARLRYAQ